ncbi:hypothetical protein AXG93_3036s1410 [Marchantia polymorpha subsp. ruderalis]|uniref:Uncharacterized protein n=1 Tax=Marchantia polymorpha subsp. ruderalis TaxID=1480154 RepID=A0A176W9D8_MARPO|nr:hypothetical protein AXG93_3036s1410 [Marchantia polymorpha subsp. ruderalis]
MTVPIKLRLPNARARTKMKARRLILEADNSTESGAVASQGRSNPEAGAELNVETVVREKEVPVEKDRQTCVVSTTPLVTRRATRKEKYKAIMTEEVPIGRDQVTSAGTRMRVPLEMPAEVLAVSSDTEEDTLALQKIVERVVEDVVIPLLRYLANKREKNAGTTNNGSYVELVRNRTQAKTTATSAAATKERQLQETESKYEVLRKRLAEEVELRRYSEKTCAGLREDIEVVRCATVDFRERLEVSLTAFNAELRIVDELTVALERKE